MSSKIVKNDTETIQEQQTNLENMETEVTLNENLMTAENREIIIDEKCSYETSEEILVSGSSGDIQGYKSDSSSDSDSEDDSEDSEESSDSESESTDSSSEDLIEISNIPKKKPIEEESWLSVIGVDKASTDLPDISSLDLDDRDEFIHMGFVENIIEKIVTVAGLSQMPSYDSDTLLFLDDKKVLGYVLDVMGPVTAPVYIIPLNSEEGIEDMKSSKGAKVYCVPKSKYTKYVHLEELMKMRGSDASWMGDAEVPPEFQEFSDDEQERMTKKEKKRKRNQEQNSETVPNMDRLPGAHTKEPNRTRQQPQHARQRNTYQAEGSPNRPQFRNNPQNVMISGPPQQNQSVLNPVAAFNTPSMMPPPVIMPPAFNPSIPPPNFGAPRFFAPPIGNIFNQYVGPHNFSPRGVNFNRNPNGSNPRQNMPGPYNGSWFN